MVEYAVVAIAGYGCRLIEPLVRPFDVPKTDDDRNNAKRIFAKAIVEARNSPKLTFAGLTLVVGQDIAFVYTIKNALKQLDNLYNNVRDKLCSMESFEKFQLDGSKWLSDYCCKDLSDILVDIKEWIETKWDFKDNLLKLDAALRLQQIFWTVFSHLGQIFIDFKQQIFVHAVYLTHVFLHILEYIRPGRWYNEFESIVSKED